MLLKTRVRRCNQEHAAKIDSFMVGNGLAQNTKRYPEFITGDYVLVTNATELMVYMEKVAQMNTAYGIDAEVVVG